MWFPHLPGGGVAANLSVSPSPSQRGSAPADGADLRHLQNYGMEAGIKDVRRYGIVDRKDMLEALQRTEKHEAVLAEFWQNQSETVPKTSVAAVKAAQPN